MDENKDKIKVSYNLGGKILTIDFDDFGDLLSALKDNFGVNPENTLLDKIDIPLEELYILPDTFGIQIIHEGAVVREWFIGENIIHCYFEDYANIPVTKEQQVALHEICLQLLKKEYPNDFK